VAAVRDQLDSVQVCTGDSDEHWVAAAQAAAVENPPDGVVAFSEPQVMAAALLQEARGLPGPSLHAAVISRNKALQRGVFATHGVRQPGHLVSTDLARDADWAMDRLPVVVKPLSASGSEGVELVETSAGYRDLTRRLSGRGTFLVESAVEGPEYSWEALVVDGSVWFSNVTEKETTGPPQFVEISHRTGVQLLPRVAAQVDELAAGVLAGLRMSTGMVHMEFRLAADGPTLMEVAVRTPGDFIMDLLGLTYGVDWFELSVRAAMSLPLPAPPTGPGRFAASYLPSAAAGAVRDINGWSGVLAHPCVVDAALLVTQGDVIAPLSSSSQRVGHMLLVADTREELDVALEELRVKLEIRVA